MPRRLRAVELVPVHENRGRRGGGDRRLGSGMHDVISSLPVRSAQWFSRLQSSATESVRYRAKATIPLRWPASITPGSRSGYFATPPYG
jgi:hypothetical protein